MVIGSVTVLALLLGVTALDFQHDLWREKTGVCRLSIQHGLHDDAFSHLIEHQLVRIAMHA